MGELKTAGLIFYHLTLCLLNYICAEQTVKSHHSYWVAFLLTLSCEESGTKIRLELILEHHYLWIWGRNWTFTIGMVPIYEFAFWKNPVVVTFAVLYYTSAAEVSILSTYLVRSICFIENAWEICVWIVLNIYIFIELKHCLGWSVKASKKSMPLDVFITAKINILLFVWLTVSFVVVPDEKESMLISENTAMFHLPPLLQ